MPGPWGPAIARLRLQRGLSKQTVAKRAKMTPTTYGRIEKGQHTQTRKLQSIAEVFSVDIAEVLSHPGAGFPQDERSFTALVARVRASITDPTTAPVDYEQTKLDMHAAARQKEAERASQARERDSRRLGRKK